MDCFLTYQSLGKYGPAVTCLTAAGALLIATATFAIAEKIRLGSHRKMEEYVNIEQTDG